MSKQKLFVGEVLKSEENNFAGANDELIEGWRLQVLLTDDRGVTFFTSKRDQMYSVVSSIPESAYVHVTAVPIIKNNGSVKYQIVAVETVDSL